VLGGPEKKIVVNYRNQDELAELMDPLIFQVTKRDVLDLPPTLDTFRYFDLDKNEAAAYTQCMNEFVVDVKDGKVNVSNALVRLLKLAQLTGGFVKSDDGRSIDVGESKAKVLSDVLEDLSNEPVVVFCRFHNDLDTVKRVCMAHGLTFSELSGRMNHLKAWQDGESDVLIVQINAGSEGIDLTRAAFCVYYSVGFSLGTFEQSQARIDRPGQTRPVTYIHLQARNTIDEVIHKSLEAKREVVGFVLDMAKAGQLGGYLDV
jgi:SNF2 family DNA or RNA helicase